MEPVIDYADDCDVRCYKTNAAYIIDVRNTPLAEARTGYKRFIYNRNLPYEVRLRLSCLVAINVPNRAFDWINQEVIAWETARAAIPVSPKPAPPPGPAPTHAAQRSGNGGNPVLGKLPSAHGGKPIPVVRSHAAIAAAKKAMADLSSGLGDPLTSKSYVLVGKKEDDGEVKVIKHWPHLPTQAEVEHASKGTKYRYTSFALTSVQNTWIA